MGIIRNFEQRLEKAFEGTFSRIFKVGVHPIEIAKRVSREAEAGKRVTPGEVLMPNLYEIFLSPVDCERLSGYQAPLTAELETMVFEIARKNGYAMLTRPTFIMQSDHSLKEGQFAVEARITSSLPPGRGAPARRSTAAGQAPYCNPEHHRRTERGDHPHPGIARNPAGTGAGQRRGPGRPEGLPPSRRDQAGRRPLRHRRPREHQRNLRRRAAYAGKDTDRWRRHPAGGHHFPLLPGLKAGPPLRLEAFKIGAKGIIITICRPRDLLVPIMGIARDYRSVVLPALRCLAPKGRVWTEKRRSEHEVHA